MLTETVTLTPTDMQDLSNSDALTALFARLGYDTNARLPQSASAMGITGDDTLTKITRIERLATNDDGVSSLQVYLFEVKSVTVALTRAIVRAFRNRQGDFLLVLTDDFERLDFVLVERYTPNPALMEMPPLPGLSAPRQVSVRPRVLTVDRRAPSKEAIRTLNRFSFTESDTLAQYDKLLAAYEAAYWSERYFDNRALFSDYYLKERLPTLAVWQDADAVTARRQAIRQLRMLDMENRETRGSRGQIEAILTILSFRALRSTGARDEGVTPDYRLFASDNGATAASAASERPNPIAICLAYPWERSLDGKDEQRDPERPEQNPGAVVVSLLDRHEADWAIVTNGKTWRLYAAKAHSRATNYYEVDLFELLASPPEDQALAFPYFWLFFRATAFVPQAQTTADNAGEGRSRSFLDALMDESERYARDLEEKLKTRVFDEIFPHFARGFSAYARREGQLPANLEDLDAAERNRLLEPFFTGTLTFLYRLLFVLYAESRDLLPVREQRGYAVQSLERLKQQISERAGDIGDQAPARIRRAYSASETALYDGLQTLFRAIDRGDPDLNVPVYNGGLFVVAPDTADLSPEAAVARFLATHKIPDRDLALGLDRLTRDEDAKTHSLAFIDFKSLGVRQLGSMYEGLLEFKLRVAPEPMAVVRGKKTEEIIPHAEAVRDGRRIITEGVGADRREKLIARGEPYLENDKRERKASGSYYTPDYIVKYIVAHTVGPVLAERLEALRPAFRAAQVALRAERQKWEAIQKQRLSVSSTPKNPEEETYLKHRSAVNEAFFDLKVLALSQVAARLREATCDTVDALCA